MNDLKRQVRQARRRLVIQQFLSIGLWAVFASLIVAAVGVAIPKIWSIDVETSVWAWSWIGGAATTGLLVAGLVTFLRRRTSLDAAIEIDRRFGLKERVSSCLVLGEDEQQSAAGKALVDDAMRRVAQVDVSDQFKVSPGRWAWLPFAAAALVFGLMLLGDAESDSTSNADAATLSSKKRVQNSTEQLKKKMQERRQQAMDHGLEDAGKLFTKLEKGMDDLSKQKTDRKNAMVKLNDLAKDIKERQKQLGSREDIRKQLNQLKDLKQGPANRMAKAISRGDFRAAIDELKKLEEQMRTGKLNEEEQKELKSQIEQMKNKLQDLADAHERAKRDLENQIQQKLSQNDRKGAEDLQRKLDQLNRQNDQMKMMSKLAQNLAECSECMKNGDSAQAANAMSDMADSLSQMAQELEEMEMLDEALDQIAMAKDSMACSNCDGQGCSMCQGSGMGDGMGMGSGMGNGQGMGEGQGSGDRPEEQTDTGSYESQVRSKIGKGRAVVAGTAKGPNKAGQAMEDVKAEIESTRRLGDDPLTGQRLPKPQRELAREYFDTFLDE